MGISNMWSAGLVSPEAFFLGLQMFGFSLSFLGACICFVSLRMSKFTR